VKLGKVCSPVLFSLFINELALDIIKGGKHGTILNQPQLKYLYHDIIFLSETAVGLQNQLNILHRSFSKNKIKCNLK